MEADRWVSGEKTCKEEVAMTERSLENKDEETTTTTMMIKTIEGKKGTRK